MNRVAILQPSYLPWLGFFDQMAQADTFVFLDDVQFTRRDWRNRNKIRTREGWGWLTVPIIQKGKFEQTLMETRIDRSTGWSEKHSETLRHHYAKTPHFDYYFPQLQSIYNRNHELLVDLCLDSISWIQKVLNIKTPSQKSSELNLGEKKQERILAICRSLGATHYFSGEAAKDYLSEEAFLRYNISLEFQDYKHPEYRQRYANFVPHLSILDLIFNHGDKSFQILSTQSDPSIEGD